MDLIAQLEATFEGLMERMTALEDENERLKEELEREVGSRKEIQSRVELLLQKLQEKIS